MKKSNTPSHAPAFKFGRSGSDVHIWHTYLDREIKEIQHISKILSSDEITRASRFYFPRDQMLFTVARAALRVILSQYIHIPPGQIAFCTTQYGKPELVNGDGVETGKLQFNLSHSGDVAVYVIARDRRVGVDIEHIRPEIEFEPLVTRYFSPLEQAAFKRFPKNKHKEVFFRIWVLKEAYLKARGEGLSIPLGSFSVKVDGEQTDETLELADDPDESTRWTLRELSLQAGYAAALAVEGHGWDMKMFELDGLRQDVSW